MRWPRLVHLYETPLWRRNPVLARANGISLSNELAFIEDAAEIDRAKSVLDLGCGTGISSRPFAARLPEARIVGLDMLPPMLHYARRKARRKRHSNLAFVRATAENLPFAPASSFSAPELEDRFRRAGLADFACLHEGPAWIVAMARKPAASDA